MSFTRTLSSPADLKGSVYHPTPAWLLSLWALIRSTSALRSMKLEVGCGSHKLQLTSYPETLSFPGTNWSAWLLTKWDVIAVNIPGLSFWLPAHKKWYVHLLLTMKAWPIAWACPSCSYNLIYVSPCSFLPLFHLSPPAASLHPLTSLSSLQRRKTSISEETVTQH